MNLELHLLSDVKQDNMLVQLYNSFFFTFMLLVFVYIMFKFEINVLAFLFVQFF